MSVDALVEQVGQVLGRAHALFGDPSASGGASALDAGSDLTGAGELVRGGRRQMSGASGELAGRYAGFTAGAGAVLVAGADADQGLGGGLSAAAGADSSGRAASGSVLAGAATDTANLAAVSGSPAGRRALLTALRARIAQQQQIVDRYEARAARLAVLLRSVGYGNGRAGRGIPMPAIPVGRGGPVGGFHRLGGSTGALAGLFSPGRVVGTPLGALSLDSGPREVAAAVVHEAQRRGYSAHQTTAILATAMQESDLHPRAESPNRLWLDIFQQDDSYPGRRNPNLAIAEFFNRLDQRGGPASPDIWKSIFWLQQRPGEPSAQSAYVNGRRAYLNEIMGQHQRAIAMYHQIVGS